jgi:hypothetical protein
MQFTLEGNFVRSGRGRIQTDVAQIFDLKPMTLYDFGGREKIIIYTNVLPFALEGRGFSEEITINRKKPSTLC